MGHAKSAKSRRESTVKSGTCVLMHQTREELLALAELAKDGVNVRFIETDADRSGKRKTYIKRGRGEAHTQ